MIDICKRQMSINILKGGDPMAHPIETFDRDFIMMKCRYLRLKTRAHLAMNFFVGDMENIKKLKTLLAEGDELFHCN